MDAMSIFTSMYVVLPLHSLPKLVAVK